jgi:hypothetical protein
MKLLTEATVDEVISNIASQHEAEIDERVKELHEQLSEQRYAIVIGPRRVEKRINSLQKITEGEYEKDEKLVEVIIIDQANNKFLRQIRNEEADYGRYYKSFDEDSDMYIVLDPEWEKELPLGSELREVLNLAEETNKPAVHIDMERKDEELRTLFMSLLLLTDMKLYVPKTDEMPEINSGYLTVTIDDYCRVVVYGDDNTPLNPYDYLPLDMIQAFLDDYEPRFSSKVNQQMQHCAHMRQHMRMMSRCGRF